MAYEYLSKLIDHIHESCRDRLQIESNMCLPEVRVPAKLRGHYYLEVGPPDRETDQPRLYKLRFNGRVLISRSRADWDPGTSLYDEKNKKDFLAGIDPQCVPSLIRWLEEVAAWADHVLEKRKRDAERIVEATRTGKPPFWQNIWQTVRDLLSDTGSPSSAG